jgi:hypothetical protein
MLRVYVKQDISPRCGEICLRVVLHMIGMQLEIFVLDFDVAVGEIEIPLFALLLCFKPHTCFGGRRWRKKFLRGDSAHLKNARDQRQEYAPPNCDIEFATWFHDPLPLANRNKER